MDTKSQTVLIGVSSGEKIPVSQWQFLPLPDGKKVEITKVSQLDVLIKSRIVVKGKNLAIDINGKKIEEIIYNERVLTIADNYEEALPISAEHRRCPFCQKPVCCYIVWSSGEKMDEYKKALSMGMFFYGSICKHYRMEFISLRNIRCLFDKEITFGKCWICGSPNPVKIMQPPDFLKRDTFFYKAPIIDSNYLFRCRNCNSITETKHRMVYLPMEDQCTEIKLLKDFGRLQD